MKSNEQARGTPLAGLVVKVVDGFFLVGLSNIDADRARNMQLLTERSWFDVPLVYANQRRAIIAIEKGAPGERAFNEAFAAWEPGSPSAIAPSATNRPGVQAGAKAGTATLASADQAEPKLQTPADIINARGFWDAPATPQQATPAQVAALKARQALAAATDPQPTASVSNAAIGRCPMRRPPLAGRPRQRRRRL